MNAIAILRPERPADLVRLLVRAGLVSGLVFALYVALVQFEALKECRRRAFSAGFSRGFDVRTAISSSQGWAAIWFVSCSRRVS